MSEFDPKYSSDAEAMLAAAERWRAKHPGWLPRFRRIPIPFGAVLCAGLTRQKIKQLAADRLTREFLLTLDRAAVNGGGGTVLQAECVIEFAYGIKNALTVQARPN